MQSVEDETFKLKWTLEEYSVSSIGWPGWESWVGSDPIHVDALGCTLWRIHMCPCTDEGYINCTIQRYPKVEEHGDISIEFSATILGKDGLLLHKTLRLINDLSPKQHINVNILPTEELLGEHFYNGQLVILYEIREITPDTPGDISSGLWHDELKVLSDDMKKLLESGYQSDVSLRSSDGRLIPSHLCVIIARWKKLQDAINVRTRRPRVVVCPNVNGQILAAFISYLYTSTIPASEVTIELFEFVVKQFSSDRIQFYTFPQEMSYRSIDTKENVVFKWWYVADTAPFNRVLPLMTTAGGDILVDISTDGSYLDVRLSFSFVDECIYLNCLAILVHPAGGFRKSADYFFNFAYDTWHFPDFIPMSFLTDGTEGVHVVFELSVSTASDWTFVESTSTEFRTGSRDVKTLASGLDNFLQNNCLDLYDVQLRTTDGVFRGYKSVLGIRSEVLRKLFRDHPKRSYILLDFGHLDPDTLSSVLEYLYTGWTKLWSIEEALKLFFLAVRMSLHGLVSKCEQFMSA